MEYEFVVAHDDQQSQQCQPQVSPNSAAFLALPEDSGPFLFSSDSSSSNHSISSNSPPNDWGTAWSEQDQLLDYSSHFHSTGIDPTQLHSFDLSFTSQNYVDLFNTPFPAQPTVIQPGVLLQKPNPSLTVQPQTTQLPAPVTPSHTEDLNAIVKRLVGITSARIPGQYEPQSLHSSLEVTQAVPVVSHAHTSSTSSTYTAPGHPLPPSSSEAPSSQPSPVPQQVGPSGRPKTAHTTIERRYRTNLNTCIIGLRNAIPAVRFLDKAFKPSSGVADVIDEHGCIDGVKCARKISKATILSKAREYITVLKKRESKLSHELEGIKSLLSSLVGGPALLEEWGRQWNAKYSQDEAMEAEGAEDVDSGDDEDEDGSGDDRPRKRPRTSNVSAAAPKGKKAGRNTVALAMEPMVPPPRAESPLARPSKKRGRSTKGVANQRVSTQSQDSMLTSQSASTQMFTFVPPQPQAQAAQQQMRPAYLLASFVFLSFFKPSNTVHIEHVHHDSGAVLSPLVQRTTPTFLGIKTDALHHFMHTIVMLGVFIALIVTAFPSLKVAFGFKSSAGSVQDLGAEKEEKSEEKHTVRVTPGELSGSVAMAEETLRSANCDKNTRKKAIACLQTVAETSPTAENLGLLALLEYANQPVHATKLWTHAKNVVTPSTISPSYLAFDLPIESAAEIVLETNFRTAPEHCSPLLVIASKALEARLSDAIQQSFVDEVDAICGINSSLDDTSITKRREARVQLTAIARKLGGRSASLADEWEVALAGRWPKSKLGTESASSSPSSAIIHAIGLIRRVFPLTFKDSQSMIGMIPSPPPSPLMQDEINRMERELRVALGSSVFYDFEGRACGGDVARARDAVISRMTSVARMRRSLAMDECE